MRKIFISYSRNDEGFARQLITALHGVTVFGFLDQADLAVGRSFNVLLRMYIREADAVVVLISPNIAESKWVIFEVGVAQGMDKRIIPVLLPGADLEGSLPEILRDIQVLDARNMSMAEVAKRIDAIRLC